MSKLIAALVGATILAAATPAAADWRFTKWGMTPEEVQAAAPDQVVPSGKKNKNIPLIIKGPYEIGGIKFDDVWFIFKAGKLDKVVMHANFFKQDELAKALATAFGPPVDSDRSRIGGSVSVSTRNYRDVAKGNAVELYCLGDCAVFYTPLDQGF
jgi:hypothetical protein